LPTSYGSKLYQNRPKYEQVKQQQYKELKISFRSNSKYYIQKPIGSKPADQNGRQSSLAASESGYNFRGRTIFNL